MRSYKKIKLMDINNNNPEPKTKSNKRNHGKRKQQNKNTRKKKINAKTEIKPLSSQIVGGGRRRRPSITHANKTQKVIFETEGKYTP